MYAEQNGRNTGNDTGAGVTQREEDTGGAEEAVIVLMRQVAADNSPFFLPLICRDDVIGGYL